MPCAIDSFPSPLCARGGFEKLARLRASEGIAAILPGPRSTRFDAPSGFQRPLPTARVKMHEASFLRDSWEAQRLAVISVCPALPCNNLRPQVFLSDRCLAPRQGLSPQREPPSKIQPIGSEPFKPSRRASHTRAHRGEGFYTDAQARPFCAYPWHGALPALSLC